MTAFLTAAWALAKRIPWQVWAVLLLVVGIYCYGDNRYAAGVAHERASWTATILATNQRAEREARAKEAEAKAHNTTVRLQYESDLARILSDRDSLARRLRVAQARPACPVPASADRPAAPDPAPQPSGTGTADAVDAATDSYDSACRLDAAQLAALIEQLRPQL